MCCIFLDVISVWILETVSVTRWLFLSVFRRVNWMIHFVNIIHTFVCVLFAKWIVLFHGKLTILRFFKTSISHNADFVSIFAAH